MLNFTITQFPDGYFREIHRDSDLEQLYFNLFE